MNLSASDYQSLEASTLLRGMSLEAMQKHLAICEVLHFEDGAVILQPGEANQCIWLVLGGALSIHLDGKDAPALAQLGPGDCVGEMSLIENQPASAWVVARSPVRLLAMPHSKLWLLVDSSHVLARNLLSILSGRVRSNNLTLVAAQEPSLTFEEPASIDALTGLHNRRWLLATMPRVLQRGERDGQPVALVVADIDRFMQFAERVSAEQRDEALRTIGSTLSDGLRAQDMIARLAEDRYVVILVRTEIDASLLITERLRELVAAVTVGGGAGAQSLTLSCGVALHHAGDTLDELIVRAETALAQAKANGRDCVEAAP